MTENFLGRKYPAANLFFHKVCLIKIALMKWLSSEDSMVKSMAEKMLEKFDKYWSSISGVLAIAAILDPRDKMESEEWYFNKIYGDMAFVEIGRVTNLMLDPLFEYEDSSDNISDREYAPSAVVRRKRHAIDIEVDVDDDDDFGKSKKSRKRKSNVRHELEYYLEEVVLPDNKDFDVLNVWKTDLKCQTLRNIAKDILAIPVSAVASESAFSMGGRVVSPHRSRLKSNTVEALMCM